MILDYVALGVIFFILVLVTVVIVLIGSLPGKIAVKRGHPWPDAVNVASWIGLATGVFWPIAFIWAYLPLPVRKDGSSSTPQTGSKTTTGDTANLEDRIAALEATIKELQSLQQEGTA